MKETADFFASLEEHLLLTESYSATATSTKRLLPHRRAEPESLLTAMPILG